jgi:hypothetical protein
MNARYGGTQMTPWSAMPIVPSGPFYEQTSGTFRQPELDLDLDLDEHLLFEI